MIIGVDAGCLGIRDKRLKVGVYQYARNLLENLSNIDSKNQYLLFTFYPIEKKLLNSFGANFKNVVIKPSIGWYKIWLPLYLKFHKIDVFLGLSQAMPRNTNAKNFGFVHGLDLFTNFHSNLKRISGTTLEMFERSEAIITTSKFLEEQIKKRYARPVIVANPGVEFYFKKTGSKYKKYRYFLFVGSLKPSKNVQNILKAFSIYKRTNKNNTKLLMITSDYWSDENITKIISDEKLTKDVIRLGFVENSRLPEFYRGAIALLSPSLYEGYGLTYLEAMSCGCPVIAGNLSAEREIVHKGGVLVNPKDVSKITSAIITIEKANSKYRVGAIYDSSKISWKKSVKQIYDFINK